MGEISFDKPLEHEQTTIEQKLESAACFLIDSNCVIEELQRDPPLSAIHQAAELKLGRVIQSLLLRPDIKPNSIFNGKTALHISIQNVDFCYRYFFTH